MLAARKPTRLRRRSKPPWSAAPSMRFLPAGRAPFGALFLHAWAEPTRRRNKRDKTGYENPAVGASRSPPALAGRHRRGALPTRPLARSASIKGGNICACGMPLGVFGLHACAPRRTSLALSVRAHARMVEPKARPYDPPGTPLASPSRAPQAAPTCVFALRANGRAGSSTLRPCRGLPA